MINFNEKIVLRPDKKGRIDLSDLKLPDNITGFSVKLGLGTRTQEHGREYRPLRLELTPLLDKDTDDINLDTQRSVISRVEVTMTDQDISS